MAPATCGLKKLGCISEREAHPEKPLLVCCHEAESRAVEVLSHSIQPHGVFQPKAPAKERDVGPTSATGRAWGSLSLKCGAQGWKS